MCELTRIGYQSYPAAALHYALQSDLRISKGVPIGGLVIVLMPMHLRIPMYWLYPGSNCICMAIP